MIVLRRQSGDVGSYNAHRLPPRPWRLQVGRHSRECDHAPLLLIPQRVSQSAKAFERSEAVDGGQLRIAAQHFRKPIKGDAAREMVNVVNADVGREPAQTSRYLEVRASVQGSFVERPAAFAIP